MTKVPVIIVDDAAVDRRIANRRLSNHPDFEPILEAESGDKFLDEFFDGRPLLLEGDLVPLILMDINMPGRNGFETIEEMQKRISAGKGPKSVAIMMFTSSDNPADRARAEALPSVIGYINKPLTKDTIATILSLYRA